MFKKITDNISNFNFYTDSNNHDPKIVLGVSETGLNVALPSGSMLYNGIYSGLIYLVFPTFTDCDIYIRYIQRPQQRELGHIKDNVCNRCGEVKTMEVRHCDYLPDIMKKAIKKHNELYNDNITEVATEFYGMICV